MRRGSARTARLLALPVWLLTVGGIGTAQTYTTVPFSYNTALANVTGTSDWPTGAVTLGGVPFEIPATGSNCWAAQDPYAAGPNPRTLSITPQRSGVTRVYTLINTAWGSSGGPWATLEFWGDNGAYHKKELYGNDDIRSFSPGNWTNSINGTTTVNVVTLGTSFTGVKRLDMQRIDLPGAFANQTLTRITLSDTGATDLQRAFLHGVTLATGGQAADPEFTISTVAGGAPPPTPMPATEAAIGWTQGVAVDAAGNLYFASINHCVFKRDLAGTLTRVAGNCRPGYSGDGGPATSAQFNFELGSSVVGIAVDAAGNVYIADYGNHRVRCVSPDGIIRTVAGTGQPGFSGDGGPATSARLSRPTGLAVDGAGNLYIAEYNRIRRVSRDGIITSPPGTDVLDAHGVAVDSAGNIYISVFSQNPGGSHILRVSPSGARTELYADLRLPQGLALDGAGNLYIADTTNYRVRRVPLTPIPGGIITVAGIDGMSGFSGDGGPATSARLNEPMGIAVDPAGNLYIADRVNSRIRRVQSPLSNGTITTVAGNGDFWFSGDGGPATSAQMRHPYGAAVDGAGNLYFADKYNHRIRRVAPSGVITTIAGTGTGGYSGDNGPAASAQLRSPSGVAVDGGGNLYIADTYNHRVRRVSGGIITTWAGTGVRGFSGDGVAANSTQLADPSGVALDTAGNLYVADSGNYRIRRVSPAGIITTISGTGVEGTSGDGGPATAATLRYPQAVAVDQTGDVYIADTYNQRVRRVSNGIITAVAGTGDNGSSGDGGPAVSARLSRVLSVAPDGAGNLYIADSDNNRLRRVSRSGIITTVAGTGESAYSGDGGPALSAQLAWPAGLALDSAGRIYVSTENAVRLLTPCTTSATPAAWTAPAAGGALNLTIQAGAGCGWSIANLPAWITASATSGSGPAAVTLNAAANPGAFRSATITAAGTAVTISQAAGGGGVCVYSISPERQQFSGAGGAGSIAVSTRDGCGWTATSATAWISITSGGSGSGNGTVNYQVLANTGGAARSGAITAGGRTFTVEQLGAGGLAVAGNMPHVASGGSWKTTFTLINNGSSAALARLNFTSGDGAELTLPLTLPQSGVGPILASAVERSVNPGAVLIVESEGPLAGEIQQGWAELLTNGAVTGYAVFRTRGEDVEPEAVVPLETRTAPGYVFAFDNTVGVVTGVAVVNLGSQGGDLSVIINDETGAHIQTSPLYMPARGHTAFELFRQYPATAGKRGTIEFRAPAGGQISVLGLRFNPKRSFSTIPVIAK